MISQPIADSSAKRDLECRAGAASHFAHIVNLGIIGNSRSEVGKVLDRTLGHINSRNLLLHEFSTEDDIAEPLGVAIDCRRFETYNTTKRHGRIGRHWATYAGSAW